VALAIELYDTNDLTPYLFVEMFCFSPQAPATNQSSWSPSQDSCFVPSHVSCLGPLYLATPQQTSVIVSRLVPKSFLAKRMASSSQKPKHTAGRTCNEKQDDWRRSSCTTWTSEESLSAKFIRKEKQWKVEACKDQDERIASNIASLGI
jgi:hypothetical protein